MSAWVDALIRLTASKDTAKRTIEPELRQAIDQARLLKEARIDAAATVNSRIEAKTVKRIERAIREDRKLYRQTKLKQLDGNVAKTVAAAFGVTTREAKAFLEEVRQ